MRVRQRLLFQLIIEVKNRWAGRSARSLMRPRLGLRRLAPRRRVAAIEGALLLPPGGTLALIDLAVMIDVDLIKTLPEAAVAVGFGKAGQPVVIGLYLL